MVAPVPALASRPLRRRWELVVWAFCALAYLVAVTSRTSLSATGIQAGERFDIGSGELAAFGVLQLSVYALCQIPAGMLIDRLGGRATFIGGLAVIAVSQLLLAVGDDFPTLLLARGVSGLGDAFVFPSAVRLIAVSASPLRVATLTQLVGTVGAFGSVVSSTPLLRLVLGAGWETAYAVTAATSAVFALVCGVILARMGPDRTRVACTQSVKDIVRGSVRAAREPGTKLAYWTHFATPSVGQVFSVAWGVPLLTAGWRLSEDQLTLFMMTVFIAGLIAGPIIGRIADRHPHRRVDVVLVSIGIQAAGWATSLLWPAPVPFVAFLPLVVALAVGGASSILAFDLTRSTVPVPIAARANGLVNTAGFTASLLGVAVVGGMLALQGASEPAAYDLDVFRVAYAPLLLIWVIGAVGVVRGRRAVRRMGAGDGPV